MALIKKNLLTLNLAAKPSAPERQLTQSFLRVLPPVDREILALLAQSTFKSRAGQFAKKGGMPIYKA